LVWASLAISERRVTGGICGNGVHLPGAWIKPEIASNSPVTKVPGKAVSVKSLELGGVNEEQNTSIKCVHA